MVLTRFLPKDEQFFTFFTEAAQNAAEAATVLREVVDGGSELERKVRRLKDLETQGDDITHRIFSALNSTFVTPINRDDIHALASELDDFVDDMEEVGLRLGLYGIGEPTETAQRLAQIIVEQAGHLAHAMPLLEAMNRTGKRSAVRWGVAGRIVSAWVITIPVCVMLGWLIFEFIDLFVGK